MQWRAGGEGRGCAAAATFARRRLGNALLHEVFTDRLPRLIFRSLLPQEADTQRSMLRALLLTADPAEVPLRTLHLVFRSQRGAV